MKLSDIMKLFLSYFSTALIGALFGFGICLFLGTRAGVFPIRAGFAPVPGSYSVKAEKLVEVFSKKHPNAHVIVHAGTFIRIYGSAPESDYREFDKQINALMADTPSLVGRSASLSTYNDGTAVFLYQWGAEK